MTRDTGAAQQPATQVHARLEQKTRTGRRSRAWSHRRTVQFVLGDTYLHSCIVDNTGEQTCLGYEGPARSLQRRLEH